MAILIVDDEANTRLALRELLASLGHKVVVEARNGQEALKVLESDKSRVRMIIADWEMPYMDGLTLVQEIEKRPELDLAPFVLITSDLSRSRIEEFRKDCPRLDASLIKPFRMASLSQAMASAWENRCRLRSTIIVASAEEPGRLRAALPASNTHWSHVVTAASPDELDEAAREHRRALGAIIVDPRLKCEEWIAAFRKTPLGTQVLLACASRAPGEIFPLRTLCQFFIDREADMPCWLGLLAQMSARALALWKLELLVQECKAAMQAKRYKDARKIAQRMLELDEHNSEVNALMGDVLASLGERRGATEHFRRAIAQNPCQPRPYIKAFELGAPLELAESAALFCPESVDVLVKAAELFARSASHARARELLERVLKLRPDHAAARELLSTLPC